MTEKLVPQLIFHTNDRQLADAVVQAIRSEYPTSEMDPSRRELRGHQPKYSVGIMLPLGSHEIAQRLTYFARGVEAGWRQWTNTRKSS